MRHKRNPLKHLHLRRRLLGLLCLSPIVAMAQQNSHQEVSWDDLVPADWDPAKEFEDVLDLFDLPDTDPRVQALYDRMRDVWDNAPTVASLNQRQIRIPGYIVPLEEDGDGLREFLLVPYFGACIHSPPPPANQIIHVFSEKPVPGLRSMDTVWVSGQLATERSDSEMGVSGYLLQARQIRRYEENQ